MESDQTTSRLLALVGVLALSAPAATAAPSAPLSQHEYKTTSAAISFANLNGLIDDLERFGVAGASERIELLLARGQYRGQLADYERATALAAELVRVRPEDPKSYLARASTSARWHRFAAATLDLDEAARHGGSAMAIDDLRASVFQATGRFDEALAIRRRRATATPDVVSVGAEATVLADRGDIAAAEPRFLAAQQSYRDVAPFPFCWLYERQGSMWLQAGDLERAREFYAAAYERIPQYPGVAAQLGWLEAASGNGERARRLLEEAAAASDDPYAAGLLAKVLQLAGKQADAEHWRARALARYEELLRTHPEAFTHHAAEFFLGAGADPVRALALARRDLEIRPTPVAYALLLRAAQAAGDDGAACAAAAGYLAFPEFAASVSPLGDRATAERAAARCGPGMSPASPAVDHTPAAEPTSR